MKFEKEATTKNGRRTWKVTYELVRGPEPKPKRQEAKAAKATGQQTPAKSEAKTNAPAKSKPAKPASKAAKQTKDRPGKAHTGKDQAQLGFF